MVQHNLTHGCCGGCSGGDVVINFVDFVGFQIQTICSFFKTRLKQKLHMCLKTWMQQVLQQQKGFFVVTICLKWHFKMVMFVVDTNFFDFQQHMFVSIV